MTLRQYLLIAATAALIGLLAPGPGRAEDRTLGEMLDDALIILEVKARFAADAPSTLSRVDVTADRRVVRLAGTARSLDERERLAAIAGRVRGVREVVNHLTVSDTGQAPPPRPGSAT